MQGRDITSGLQYFKGEAFNILTVEVIDSPKLLRINGFVLSADHHIALQKILLLLQDGDPGVLILEQRCRFFQLCPDGFDLFLPFQFAQIIELIIDVQNCAAFLTSDPDTLPSDPGRQPCKNQQIITLFERDICIPCNLCSLVIKDRITSYNVCYTKLLRRSAQRGIKIMRIAENLEDYRSGFLCIQKRHSEKQ